MKCHISLGEGKLKACKMLTDISLVLRESCGPVGGKCVVQGQECQRLSVPLGMQLFKALVVTCGRKRAGRAQRLLPTF